MKKILYLWIIFSINYLFSSTLIVEKADVLLLINGQEFTIPKDQNLTLKPGTMVCFLKGNGNVIIDSTIKLNQKNPECYQIPIDNINIDKILTLEKKHAVISTQKIEKSSNNRAAEEIQTETGEIIIPSSKKELIIYGEQYGTLPITLNIKDPNGKVIRSITNEENEKSLFRVPTAYLKNGSNIEISNGLGDKMVDQKIIMKASSDPSKHEKIFYENKKDTIVDILYGTDRKRNKKKTNWENYYTGERGKLKYGIAQVSIPKVHILGKMERPKHWWQSETIGKHILITDLKCISKQEFLKFFNSKLTHVEEKDVLIFIHGFNVTFAAAIRTTAQITYDLKFKGVPMTYSWPSLGKVSEYMSDEASVQYAVPHLVAFLKTVIEGRNNNTRIHIIAHSMGTRLLTNALKEISFLYPNKHVFKNIILAAPDIDRDVFKESLFPYIRKTTDLITLYASSDDKALQASSLLHGGTRIGQSGDDIFVFKGLDTIDASGIDTSMLGHSYFAEKEILIKDLKEVIHKSLPPKKRDTLIERIKANIEYWKFKLSHQN
jgi:esterase/lipase superfamily enzyme